MSSPRHGSHICSPVTSFSPGAHRCFSVEPTGVYRGGRAPTMKVGGHRELGTGEHMWDPCREELSHLSLHFWQMVLEGDGITLGSEGVSAVRARTACSQSRTAEISSGGRVKRSQSGGLGAHVRSLSSSRPRHTAPLFRPHHTHAARLSLHLFLASRPHATRLSQPLFCLAPTRHTTLPTSVAARAHTLHAPHNYPYL